MTTQLRLYKEQKLDMTICILGKDVKLRYLTPDVIDSKLIQYKDHLKLSLTKESLEYCKSWVYILSDIPSRKREEKLLYLKSKIHETK